jgi:hypothetical protein
MNKITNSSHAYILWSNGTRNLPKESKDGQYKVWFKPKVGSNHILVKVMLDDVEWTCLMSKDPITGIAESSDFTS